MIELLKRYWMVLAAGALAIWTAYALINPALHLQRSYERQADADTAYYAEKAQSQYAWDCARMASPAKDKCRYEKAQAAREGQHDADDLKAQLVTSVWTRQMGIAAIIGAAVSIIGVILVWITFRAAREGNVIARESAEAQVRAWVTIEFEEVIGFRIVNGNPHFHARVKVVNIGDSPALAVTYWMGMAFGKDPRKHLDNAVERYRNANLDWKEGSLFHSDSFVRRCSCEHSGRTPKRPTKVSVFLIAVYQTALSETPRITAHLYDVIDTRRGKDKGWTIDFRNPPSGDNLYMRTNKEFPGYAN